MTGHINELIASRFVVNADTLKEFDSLIRLHRDDIDPNAIVRYSIRRADSYKFDTEDIEDVIRERNGPGTRIVSIKLEVRGSRLLNFDVDLANKIRLRGNCEDRAKLLALVTDIRGLMQDRMIKGRRWGRKLSFRRFQPLSWWLDIFDFKQFKIHI
jgi:hypothetical protein